MPQPGPSYYNPVIEYDPSIDNKYSNEIENPESDDVRPRRAIGVAAVNEQGERVASFDYNFNPFEDEIFEEAKKEENRRNNLNLNITRITEPNNDEPRTPDYINETVMYNQFDNININEQENNLNSPENTTVPNFRLNEAYKSSYFSSTSSNGSLSRPIRQAPPVPTSLDLNTSNQRPFLNSPVTPCSDDGLSLSPLPVADFNDPPPSYSEAQDSSRLNGSASVTTPPRTQVILPATDVPSIPNGEFRKYLTCQHCRMRVHTLVLRQSGLATHAIAITTIIFCLFPAALLVYWTNICKYRNHYCTYCGKLIGYEVPILCQKIVYTDPQPV